MPSPDAHLRLRNAIERVETLPAMPVIAQQLLSLALDTDESEAKLVTLIEQDPQIMAKLLSLSNSPAMKVTRPVVSVSDAVMILGLTQVKSVSIAIAAMSGLKNVAPGRYFSPQSIYSHSLAMAIVMVELSAYMPHKIRPSRDKVYLAGLLHDIGYMAIHFLDRDASERIHHRIVLSPKDPVLLVDLGEIGVTHCDVGAQLARQWNLSDEIVSVIARHHDPRVELLTAANCLPTLALLAEKALADFGLDENMSVEILERDWKVLGIDPGRSDEIMGVISEIVAQLAHGAD